jgi:serine/threonine-protein kinase
MVGTTISHYEVLEQLGGGGMGVVYKAEDTRLGRYVALKFLPEKLTENRQALERFQREARAASALDHPNICTIYDIGEHEEQPFIVMQYLEGQTLRHHLEDGPLSTEQLLDFGSQIAEALDSAHTRGILHRDIKPDNVFVTRSGQIKLLDFGLAKLLEQNSDGPPDRVSQGPLTAAGIAVGTPYYMSPEQLLDKKLDDRSDVFSFGVLLYEMATGTLPFKGKDLSALFNEILNKTPISPRQLSPDLPDQLRLVLNRALEKDRDVRYQSIRDLMTDLLQTKGSSSTLSTSSNKTKPSIAVLPFVNMSSDPDNEYFSDGLAEELINALTQLRGLHVASRTSAFSFKGMNQSIPDIGRQLGVDTILEGSVRKADKRLRITAQLINTADGYHIWSERFDREMADIFDLQDEITRKIVNKLSVNLTRDSEEILVKRSTENVEAYNLYLKGRFHLNQRTESSVLKAIECFELATSEDNLYSLPHAGLAEAYILLNIDCPRLFCERDPAEMVSRATKAAQKAIELDDSCAEAHVALALVYYRLDWNWKGAEQEFILALERNQNLATARHQYAMFLASVNRLDEALAEIKRAHELDPVSPIISTAVGRILHFSRRFDEAIDQCRRTLELNPQFPGAYFDMGLSYIAKGMYLEAVEAFKKLGELSGDPKRGLIELAWVYSHQGARDKAFAHIEELMEHLGTEDLPRLPLAIVHIGLGDLEKAFELLEEGYTQRDSNLLYLQCESAFDPLRDDPRFHDLLLRMNFEPSTS